MCNIIWCKISFHSLFIFLILLIHYCTDCKYNDTQSKSLDTITASKTSGTKEQMHSTERSQQLATITTERILPEWGGNCTKKHWDKCSHLDKWVTTYLINKKKPELGYKTHETDCKKQPVLCLRNGWTVTRCQLLCMRCNREIMSKNEKYVAKDGAC